MAERVVKTAAELLQQLGLTKADQVPAPAGMAEIHNRILSQVHFSEGARAADVAALIQNSGFANVTVDTDLKAIHRAQSKHLSYLKGLSRGLQHRYAIVARKPLRGL